MLHPVVTPTTPTVINRDQDSLAYQHIRTRPKGSVVDHLGDRSAGRERGQTEFCRNVASITAVSGRRYQRPTVAEQALTVLDTRGNTASGENTTFAGIGEQRSSGPRFLAALEPLRTVGKLGSILLQFPPWFTVSRANKGYTLSCAERLGPDYQPCVEFRHESWMSEHNRAETLGFLAGHRMPLVCVDMPQGYRSSIPPIVAAAAELAVMRFHGHSSKWTSTDVHERFGYLYDLTELREWAPRIRDLASAADRCRC